MSKTDHNYRINNVLSLIHKDIAGDLRASTLAKHIAYSEQHFHRIFKQVTGESVHDYVRHTRLENAANQLLFSPERTIQVIAETCGFNSLSSFTRTFKSHYGLTPGQWRRYQCDVDQHNYLSDPEINAAYQRLSSTALPKPEIVQLAPQHVAYIRHKGYGRSIANTWQTLKAWAISEQRSMDKQIGLHHSNPALVPLEHCHYVACLGIDQPITRRGSINSATIPGGMHACFKLKGQYGDLLPYLSKILEQWLPASGFICKTTPAFAVYQRNQFLAKEDFFELEFYLPICFS